MLHCKTLDPSTRRTRSVTLDPHRASAYKSSAEDDLSADRPARPASELSISRTKPSMRSSTWSLKLTPCPQPEQRRRSKPLTLSPSVVNKT